MSRKPRLTQARSNNRQSDTPDGMNARTRRQARRLGRQQKQLESEVGVGIPVVAGQSQSTRGRMIKYGDIKQIEPLTDTQADFFDAWEDDQAVGYVLYGSAGCGKSFLSFYHALLAVMDPNQPQYEKIVIIRSMVQTRDIGFLPGLEEKFEPYEAPYHDIAYDLIGIKGAYDKLKETGKVVFLTTSFLRSVTLNNAIVIFDESQSENFHGISSVMTRLGKNSKLIVCGDGAQNDLIKSKHDVSGFHEFLEVSRKMPEFRHFKFTSDDICRSGFVRSWIVTCEKLGLQ
jgi:phosphate starvation-inducible protein PhoH